MTAIECNTPNGAGWIHQSNAVAYGVITYVRTNLADTRYIKGQGFPNSPGTRGCSTKLFLRRDHGITQSRN